MALKKLALDMDEMKKRIAEIKSLQVGSEVQNGLQKPICELCGDNGGFAVRNEDGIEVYKPCSCLDTQINEKRFSASKITFAFRSQTFDKFNLANLPEVIRDAYRCSRSYLNSFEEIRHTRENSIALLGNPGSGKTHLLMAICNELMDRGINVLYFPYVETFLEFKEDVSRTNERVKRMQEVDVLFIDDLFKGRDLPTPYQIEILFSVINERYMQHKPILISSERDIEAMMAVDEALGSRINQMCKDFRVILLGGRDLNYRMREG